MIFIIKGFRATMVFMFIVIFAMFRPICPPAFFRCLSNSRTYTELRTESEQAIPVDSIKDLVRSSVSVPEFDKHLKKAEGHIGRNVVEITIKMKTIVRKPLMIKIIRRFVNAKAIFVEDQLGILLNLWLLGGGNERVHIFHKCIIPIVNVIVRLKF